jgi:hypothetical protein
LDQETLFETFYKQDGVLDFLKSVPEYKKLRRFSKEDKPLIPPRFLLEDSVTLINQLSIPDDSTRTEMINYLVEKSGTGKITPHSETPLPSLTPTKPVTKPEPATEKLPLIAEPLKTITKPEPIQEDFQTVQELPKRIIKPEPIIEELPESTTKPEPAVPENPQKSITKPESVQEEPPTVQEPLKKVTKAEPIGEEPQKSSIKPEPLKEEPQKSLTKPTPIIQQRPKRITKRRREIEEDLQRKREIEESQQIVAEKPAQASNKSNSRKAFLTPLLFLLLVAVAVTLFYFFWEKAPDKTSEIRRGLGNNAKNNRAITPVPVQQEATNDSVANKIPVATPKKVVPTKDTVTAKERNTTISSEPEQEVAISAIPDAQPAKEIGVKGTKGNITSSDIKGRYKIRGKAYFHNEPDENTRRNAFVLHWNNSYATLEALEDKNGFIYVIFTNHLGQTSKGWLPKEDLIQVK